MIFYDFVDYDDFVHRKIVEFINAMVKKTLKHTFMVGLLM